jgi:hypothetical protein
MSGTRRAALPALIVVVAAAAYEAAVALGVIALGSEPGDGPPGEEIVLTAALLAMLAVAFLAAWWSRRGHRVALAELLAPAGAAFLVARFYSFDPYYLPTLRRASDDGLVAPELVFLLTGLALVAGLLVRLRPRVGLWLTSPVMVGCALFAWVAFGGH